MYNCQYKVDANKYYYVNFNNSSDLFNQIKTRKCLNYPPKQFCSFFKDITTCSPLLFSTIYANGK